MQIEFSVLLLLLMLCPGNIQSKPTSLWYYFIWIKTNHYSLGSSQETGDIIFICGIIWFVFKAKMKHGKRYNNFIWYFFVGSEMLKNVFLSVYCKTILKWNSGAVVTIHKLLLKSIILSPTAAHLNCTFIRHAA